MISSRMLKLSTAVMLMAALTSYLGLPRIFTLSRLDSLVAMRVLDLSERLRLSQQLAALKPLSAEAEELAREVEKNAQALAGICENGEFFSAPAPALANSLGYMAIKPSLDAPNFSGSFLCLLPEGIQSLNRPPPLLGPTSDLFSTPPRVLRGYTSIRAP